MLFNENEPIYIQVYNHILIQIATGKYPVGEKIPSVRELSIKLKINPNTISKALKELENLNIIYVKRGIGNFVSEDEDKIRSLKEDMLKKITTNFIENLKKLGITLSEVKNILNKREEGCPSSLLFF